MTNLQEKRKAFCYITRGRQLLVFIHPEAPEAGIQVPAGTVEPHEDWPETAMREAYEETGLENLKMMGFLGELRRDMRDFGKNEIHHRHYFHFVTTEPTQDSWQNIEKHACDGSGDHLFEFFWIDLDSSIPELIADHGYLLNKFAD